MSKRSPLRLALLPAATMAVALAVTNLPGAESSPEAARLDGFTHTDGANYFALALKPAQAAPSPGPCDVVVLYDSSASQTGPYRAQGLTALKSLLGELSPQDRIQLVAVDVNAIGMTESFVAPGSQEMTAAIEKLEARVPLGATDVEKAVSAAVERFAGAGANPRAVVYIGDGMSTANLVGTETFEKLVGSLVENRIAVTSYAVGPRLDMQVLGALAANTGGQLLKDEEVAAEKAGSELAAAAKGAVLWPESVTWPAAFREVFPGRTPPLRADRESVIIGTYEGEGPFEVQMTVGTAEGSKPLKWTIEANPPQDTNSYIARLVEGARVDGGVSLPLVGSAGLKAAERQIGAGQRQVSRLAVDALASNDLASAERLAREALRQDPEDAEARIVVGAVQRRRAGADAGAPADLNLVGPAAGAAAKSPVAQPDRLAAPGRFMDSVERQRKVIEEMISADVTNTINQARGMAEEPEAAIQDLKQQLEYVKRVPELEPDIRDQLVNQLQAAVRQAEQQQTRLEKRRQEQHEVLAMAKERELINEELLRGQQKMEQLMERFNSLMEEGRHRMAEEQIALEAQELAPNDPVPVAATHISRIAGYYEEALALRVAHQKGVMDVLISADRSSIPFPDEPPIVYPDAETWQRLSARRIERYSTVDLAGQGPSERRIAAALKEPTELEFIEAPLQDVMDTLEDFHHIQIEIDTRALEDVGVQTDTPITKSLKGISLRSGLRLMLKELDLTYVVQDEVLLITTPEEAETRLATKVYPVGDLVVQPGIFGGMGGGMMGGGMMGGGMMGGGMMGGGGFGGGRGGFGGGFGGGRGGFGGGGGMFNVPPNLLQNVVPNAVPQGGFRPFAVEDDLSLTPEGEPRTAQSQVSPKAAAKLQAIPVDENADPQVFWDRHFAKKSESRAVVRETVRELMRKQQFDHVIALIQAALRRQQPQPWMYEAMALAMQADGRPEEEVERAVMSAVDFAENPLDLMYIGVYLDRIGLERRALQLYRQVSNLAPLRYEPYMQGLAIAQKLDDLDAVQWATTGILSQAWPEEKKDIWLTGLGAASDTLKRLRSENRTAEADRFEAALDEAVERDIVVEVSWTGDADVDMMVAEPNGTVCSFRNPRTTAGGVMLGDTYSHLGENPADGLRETYVCPQGFDGQYRMLLRRVWGDVTAGKVAVTVHTHVWGEAPRTFKKMVPLTNDEAVVQFDLEGGRRKESLEAEQVAVAADAAIGRVAARHHVLAQQLAAGADPLSMASFAQSRQRPFVGGFFPVVGGGAVGYQPVVVPLPEGAMLMAYAVISADRRYVRVDPMPMFMAVGEVFTFNTSSGANLQGQGGTGGRGFSGLFGGGFGGGGGGFGGGGGGFF